MLFAQLKLSTIVGRAFRVMADLQWPALAALVVVHAVSSWVFLALCGETKLIAPSTFLYWYATTAYTVGYGDLSPQGAAGRILTALWIFPGAIAAFTTVVAKVLQAIGDIWRLRRAGKGDYSKMSEAIVLIGYNPARTPRMLDELRADLAPGQTLVLLTRQTLADPPVGVLYVQSESLTGLDAMKRASLASASRVLIYTDSDSDTLAATLAAAASAPATAHIVCFLDSEDHARLVEQHCPEVEVVVAAGPELLVRACRDPGASQVISALTSHLDAGATLFSLAWPPVPATAVGEIGRRLLARRATLLAVQAADAPSPAFNVAAETPVAAGDRLFYVAAARLDPAHLAGDGLAG